MKSILNFFTFLLVLNFTFAQKLEIQTLLQDNISIRALQIWDGKVWYSGTDSKFGYVSLKDTLDKKQILLSDKKLQFRTLAQNRTHFFTINIESPAHFFKIDKKEFTVDIIHQDSAKNAFYDALLFHEGNLFTFSDPDENLKLKFLEYYHFNNKFNSKLYSEPSLKEGEAAFAASNTNISAFERWVWFATGGKFSRIFRLNLKQQKIQVFETPFIQGTSSQGIYSIDFHKNKFGIAVGGDYTKQAENINNIATSVDCGETWQVQASGKNAGYMTCVKIRPKSKGKEIIAVGDQHISFSNDYGKTWTKISDEKGLFVCEWIDKNTLVFAGKNRLVKAEISY